MDSTETCRLACDKYYIIEYDHYGYKQTVKGLLLNYYNGNIVLLADEGIYHLKYKDIIFMEPIRCKDHDKRLG